MSLHMLSFRPDLGRLMRLAHRERLLPTGDDLGYAVHAVFTASFGDVAPKPFALLLPGEPGGGPAGRLLAYSTRPLDELLERAAAFADPAFSAPLMLEEAEAKTMPARFAEGMRLGFRVRLRPVVRTGKPPSGAGDQAKARERDVYDGPAEGESAIATRGRVYLSWLEQRLAETAGARLEQAALQSFRQTRLLTRDRAGEAPRSRVSTGPDAVMHGILAVTDPDTFAVGLARGIGRHRAFGFGMLLLTPPRT